MFFLSQATGAVGYHVGQIEGAFLSMLKKQNFEKKEQEKVFTYYMLNDIPDHPGPRKSNDFLVTSFLLLLEKPTCLDDMKRSKEDKSQTRCFHRPHHSHIPLPYLPTDLFSILGP